MPLSHLCSASHNRVAVYCSVLQCVAVCCSVLQCVAVRCIALQHVAACCCETCLIHTLIVPHIIAILIATQLQGDGKQCVAAHCSVLLCVAVCSSALQCVAVCCNVLPYLTMSCSVLPCAALCCSVLQSVAVCCCGTRFLNTRWCLHHRDPARRRWRAVCCSVVQRVAVRCGVFQCDAE